MIRHQVPMRLQFAIQQWNPNIICHQIADRTIDSPTTCSFITEILTKILITLVDSGKLQIEYI